MTCRCDAAIVAPLRVCRCDVQMVGTAALFLAGKVEECPRKLRDVIQAMQVTMGKPKLDPTTEVW